MEVWGSRQFGSWGRLLKRTHAHPHRARRGTVRVPPRALGMTLCRWELGPRCSGGKGGGEGRREKPHRWQGTWAPLLASRWAVGIPKA